MNNQKTLLILGMTTLLVIIGGSVYIYKNKKAEVPSSDKTINSFTTYTNAKYEFEMAIPQDWKTVVGEGSGCTECGETAKARFFLGVNPFLNGMDRGIGVYVYDRKNDKQYETIKEGYNLPLASRNGVNKIQKNKEICLKEHIKDVKIGESGLSAIEVYDAQDDCFSNIYQFIIKGNKYDYLVFPWPANGTSYVGYDGKMEVSRTLPEFDQILSTFKLVSSSQADTSTWKTYENSYVYSFKINYPSSWSVFHNDSRLGDYISVNFGLPSTVKNAPLATIEVYSNLDSLEDFVKLHDSLKGTRTKFMIDGVPAQQIISEDKTAIVIQFVKDRIGYEISSTGYGVNRDFAKDIELIKKMASTFKLTK